MAKRLFLFLILSIIGAFTSVEFLTADDAPVAGQPDFNAVETIDEINSDSTGENTQALYVARANSVNNASNATYSTSSYTVPANNIAIFGRTLEIIDVADTTVNSGNHVNKYGSKFLYGHNTSAVFGNLVNMGVGSTFTVTYGGTVTNYRVAKVMIYEKNVENGRLQLNGSGNYMRGVANAVSDGVNYDLSIMTCYGTSYGNGDASHRLVLFAYAY